MNRSFLTWLCMTALLVMSVIPAWAESVFPGVEWKTKSPEEVQLSKDRLDQIAAYLGGRGFVARHGYQVYTWGDYKKRGDIASAAKPFYSFFLFKALETKRIPSLDQPVAEWEPKLKTINPELQYKDAKITWRHMANQISCYGLKEAPGTAFDYNDWQMALLWDCLFTKVYKATFETVDAEVLTPLLSQPIQCQDSPTFMAFGPENRAGRTAVSPRDFARFGLLFLHQGKWNDQQILSPQLARQAVSSPVPATLPRAGNTAAKMIPGQRSIGSTRIPDNQCDHRGSYSWLWWINGTDREGHKFWPDAPDDVFTALGHANGKRGLAVIPSLDMVISWNDTKLDTYPESPHPLNHVFKLLKD